jgi:hypothetical protein
MSKALFAVVLEIARPSLIESAPLAERIDSSVGNTLAYSHRPPPARRILLLVSSSSRITGENFTALVNLQSSPRSR